MTADGWTDRQTDGFLSLYHKAGYFSEVQIFPNWLMTPENLFWAADCFKKLYCGIEILRILAWVNGNNV